MGTIHIAHLESRSGGGLNPQRGPRHLCVVTAAGMPVNDAADLVRHMAGRFRLPDTLRHADALARTGQSTGAQTS